MLFYDKAVFAELSTTALTPSPITTVDKPHREYAMLACSPCRLFGANPALSVEACKECLPSTKRKIIAAGPAPPKQASPP